VFVNGVEAEVDENGTWTAQDVPIYGRGTATFDAVATSPGSSAQQGLMQMMSASTTGPVTASKDVEKECKAIVVEHRITKQSRWFNTEHVLVWDIADIKTYDAGLEVGVDGNWKPTYHGTLYDDYFYLYDNGWETDIQWSDTNAGTYHSIDDWALEYEGEMDWGNYWVGNYADNGPTVTSVPDEDLHSYVTSPVYVSHYFGKDVKHYWTNASQTAETTITDAHTTVRLYTGGKSKIGSMNLFRINCSAQSYGAPAAPQPGNPWLWTPAGGEIKPGDLQCGGLKVGSDGVLWLALADNSERDITITAPAKHFRASAEPTKHKLKIRVNDNILLESDKVVDDARFCVGQQVRFTYEFDPELTAQIQEKVVDWTFKGKYVNDHTNAVSNKTYPDCSVNYFENRDLLENEVVTNWWVSGKYPHEEYSAKFGVNLEFANGQQAVPVTKGLFHMMRPLPQCYAEFRGVVAADTNYFDNYLESGHVLSVPWLHFGVSTSPYPTFSDSGVVLGYSNAPVFTDGFANAIYGDYFFTQIICQHTKRNVYIETICSGEEINKCGLDNQILMNDRLGVTRAETWHDSPGSPLNVGTSWLSREDSFQTFLMFKPDGDEDIPVPMFKVVWSWSGAARTNGVPDNFSLISSSTGGPTVEITTEFPQWTNIVMNTDAFIKNLPCFDENGN
jgi:hypothetical protein